MNEQIRVTTVDNPFNPFTDFDDWFLFDVTHGYYTCARVARLAKLESDMTTYEEEAEVERAMRRLVEIDPLDVFKIVTNDDKNDKNIK